MCWQNIEATKQVAKRDFYVYKIGFVIGNNFSSLYQKYNYKIKRSNPVIPLKPVRSYPYDLAKIETGYHSYKEVAIEFYPKNPYFRNVYLGDVITGYIDKFECYSALYVGTFIVPKGSEYYINTRGEIVSSNIIYTGKWVKL